MAVYMCVYKDDYDDKIIILYAACKAVDCFVHNLAVVSRERVFRICLLQRRI